MNFSDIAAIAFWPIHAAIAYTYWTLTPPKRRMSWIVLAVCIIIFGSLIGWSFLLFAGFQSTIVLFDFYFGVLLFGAMLGTLMIPLSFGSSQAAEGWRKRHRFLRAAVFLINTVFSTALVLWGAVTLLRDHLEDRKFLSGSVSATRDVLSSRRGPTEYKITVGIDEINLTSRMAPTIRIGDRIRAEIGRGSHYAYKIEKLP